MLEFLLSLLILIGAGFTLVGSLGLLRLRDFYSRLHAPTKASTLGVGSLLIASALFFSFQEGGLSLHEVLVTLLPDATRTTPAGPGRIPPIPASPAPTRTSSEATGTLTPRNQRSGISVSSGTPPTTCRWPPSACCRGCCTTSP